MTTVAPRVLVSSAWADLAIVSTPDATATGRMNWIVLPLGWASAVLAVAKPATANDPPASNLRRVNAMLLILDRSPFSDLLIDCGAASDSPDGSTALQRLDFSRIESRFPQNLVGVLADARRLAFQP